MNEVVWFGFNVFYDISTLVGYLMPNPVRAYTSSFVFIVKWFKYCYLIVIILFTFKK